MEKFILGARLPVKVPVFSVELHDDKGPKLICDESSNSELMGILAGQIREGFRVNS